MSFTESIKYVFSNYAVFRGRASRSQFWFWVLFVWIAQFVLNIIDSALGLRVGASTQDLVIGGQVVPFANSGVGVLSILFAIAIILPNIGVAIRRLHDSGKTGWWLLIGVVLTPLCGIGAILLFVMYLLPSTQGANTYGSAPDTIE